MKKYKLLNYDTITIQNKTLHRIQALKDFNDVRKGELGGYVESEDNLSHDGFCWVYGNAQVYGNAKVCGNAEVCGNAQIYANACIYYKARVYGNAKVYGNAQVYGNAKVSGEAKVYGNAKVSGEAKVFGSAWVYDHVRVYDETQVYDSAYVHGEIEIRGDARVSLPPILFYYKWVPCHFLKGDKIFLRAGCLTIYSWKELRKALRCEFGEVDQDALDLAYIQLKIFKKQIKKKQNL